MKKNCIVKLIKENPQTRANKIKVGEIGGTIEDLGGKSKVVFLSDINKSSYKPFEIEDNCLEVIEGSALDKQGNELAEYDEVILDSDDYKFKRGARGIIIHNEFIGGVAMVDFVSEFDEDKNEDTIITVKTSDLIKKDWMSRSLK